MENRRELWNKACLHAGIPAISTDTAARIMAVVYVHGNNEAFTFNQNCIADMDYIQKRFGMYGAGVPDSEFARLLKGYIKELEEFIEKNKHLAEERGVVFYDAKPQWATDLFKENYNITL